MYEILFFGSRTIKASYKAYDFVFLGLQTLVNNYSTSLQKAKGSSICYILMRNFGSTDVYQLFLYIL